MVGTVVLFCHDENMSKPAGKRPVRVGVVGWGRFGRLHALTLNRLAEAELVAIVARRNESLEAAREELPDVPGWIDLPRAIEESGADAWIVACSTSSHVDVTRCLLEAGKTVLLEKPIAGSLADAESLASLLNEDASNLMIGHILLFNSEFCALREEVQQRGPIAYIDCVRHRPASIVQDFSGENPLHAAMVHDLYCVQVLLDCQEPDGMSAQYHRTSEGAIDLALAQLHWNEGPVASFAASYLTPAGMPPRGIDRTEVFGDGWAACISPNPRPIEVWSDQAEWPMALEIRTDESGPTGMMAEEQRCFCRVVSGQQPIPRGATYADAMQVQRWMQQLTDCAQN
jgi:predicted dehydrogenase